MAISGTVPVGGLFAPTSETDTYAITDAKYSKDGLRNVSSIAERNAITAERRQAGMLVGVLDNNEIVYYALLEGPWNFDSSDWIMLNISQGFSLNKLKFTIEGGTSNTSFQIPHNFSTRDHLIQIFDTDGEEVLAQITRGENIDILNISEVMDASETFTVILIS